MPNIAAIDVGSNAIRILIASQDSDGRLNVLRKTRHPLRLGRDTFDSGTIQPRTIEEASQAFLSFANMLEESSVQRVRAVATSAVRDAANAKAFVKEIARSTGIHIEIIDGLEEGRLIHRAVAKEIELVNTNALLIDIGGGSVELTVSRNAEVLAVKTFKLGTVRVLQMIKDFGLKESDMNGFLAAKMIEVKDFLTESGVSIGICIGTGGNLESLGKLRRTVLGKNSEHMISRAELESLIQHLQKLSLEERVSRLGLRPDRADVIMPAAQIFHLILGLLKLDLLQIPNVGLSHGVLIDLAQRKN